MYVVSDRADRLHADTQRERAGSFGPDRHRARWPEASAASPSRSRSRRTRPPWTSRPRQTGQDITLQLTESLPTGRSLSELPAARAGRDARRSEDSRATRRRSRASTTATSPATLGVSSDNFYYFNGINVTDPVTGTFGANLNTEIIQEQKVLTGGIPAEFVGTPGLLSNVITKSGTNRSRARSTTSSRTTTWSRRTRTPPTRCSRRTTRPARSAARSSGTRPGSSAATAASSGRTT